MGMLILRIASSRIVGQDIVGRSGYFSLNLSNSVMRVGRLDARRTLKKLAGGFEV